MTIIDHYCKARAGAAKQVRDLLLTGSALALQQSRSRRSFPLIVPFFSSLHKHDEKYLLKAKYFASSVPAHNNSQKGTMQTAPGPFVLR